MFTHARCGGVLIPIAVGTPYMAKGWGAGDWVGLSALPVRCDRCRLEGEVAQQEETDLERRRLWRGLRVRGEK